jgi:hypothetical protein
MRKYKHAPLGERLARLEYRTRWGGGGLKGRLKSLNSRFRFGGHLNKNSKRRRVRSSRGLF